MRRRHFGYDLHHLVCRVLPPFAIRNGCDTITEIDFHLLIPLCLRTIRNISSVITSLGDPVDYFCNIHQFYTWFVSVWSRVPLYATTTAVCPSVSGLLFGSSLYLKNHALTMPYVIVSIHCESSYAPVVLVWLLHNWIRRSRTNAHLTPDYDTQKAPVSVCFGVMLSTWMEPSWARVGIKLFLCEWLHTRNTCREFFIRRSRPRMELSSGFSVFL